MISFEFQKSVHNYSIDLYVPDQKLAIENDEPAHADRNVPHEQTREQIIVEQLGCRLLRINPDHQDDRFFS